MVDDRVAPPKDKTKVRLLRKMAKAVTMNKIKTDNNLRLHQSLVLLLLVVLSSLIGIDDVSSSSCSSLLSSGVC